MTRKRSPKAKSTVPQWRARLADHPLIVIVDEMQRHLERHIWRQPGHEKDYQAYVAKDIASFVVRRYGKDACRTILDTLLREVMPDLVEIHFEESPYAFGYILQAHVKGTRPVIKRQKPS